MDGMEAIEFTPPGRLIRFLEDSDMNDVYLMENKIHSLPYQDVEISGSNDQTVNIICLGSCNFGSPLSGLKVLPKLVCYSLSHFSTFPGSHSNNAA